MEPNTFTGLLIPEQPIKLTDYVQGDPGNPLRGLDARILNPTGKWAKYRPPLQRQKSAKTGFESNDCTGYGLCRKVAADLNCMLWEGMLPAAFVEWAKANKYIQYPDGYPQGTFLFDPQVLGIMAGTTQNGNWLQVVADTARKNGLLPAGTLPGPDGYQPGDWAGFYNKELITPEIRSLGLEFLKWVDLPYQWRNIEEGEALKACSLYSAVCTCAGWSSDSPVKWCNAGDATNHAVGQTDDQEILDSYPPDLKQLSSDYAIPYQLMVLTTVKEQPTMAKTIGYKIQNNPTIYVLVGSNLVPVADWPAFIRLGGDSNSVVTLADSELAKFTIVSSVLFKSA